MNESLYIAKTLIRGALIGLNTYIKPGGIHRLTPLKAFDDLTCNIASCIDTLVESVEAGSMVKRGEVAVTSVDYNKLFTSPLKESFRNCSNVYPEYLVPLTVLGFTIGLSSVESILEESSKFKKALEAVNNVNKWSDIKQLIEVLRIIGRADMYEHLQSTGYTQITLLKSGATFNDVFRVLSSRWRGFSLVDSKETLVFQYLKQLFDLQREYKNLENSLIALYMELVKQHIPVNLQDKAREAHSCKYMATPECAKLMYELDVLLRKNKVFFEWASEITVLVSALAVYEGLK
jgi:hypothetical protein